METQTQEPIQETPTPKRSVLPYFIGAGLVVLLAAAAFIAVRYLRQKDNAPTMGFSGNQIALSGPDGVEHTFSLDIEPAKELPQTQPETMGLFVERKDNSVFIGTGEVNVMVKAGDAGGEPVVDTNYSGDKVEVVISNDTIVYRDTTVMDPENPEEAVQQTVEVGTIDDITPQSSITVWGRKVGDRVIADVIMFSSPFVFQKGAP